MSLPFIFDTDARVEFDEAFDWYELRRPGLGPRFAEAVQDRLNELTAQPLRYPVVFQDVREAPVTGFPYCVYYAIEPTHVVVVFVFHTSRDPAVWKRRRNTP